MSAAILSVFRCRQLGESFAVLEADVRVTCTDSSEIYSASPYGGYRNTAWVLLLVWPVGIPLVLWVLLVRSGVRKWSLVYSTADSGEGGLHAADSDALRLVTDAQARYNFLLDDFRPGCWWFEPVDMLRKLLLSGLLQFVERGTALQCFCGCCLALVSLSLQLHVAPYAEAESNFLKASAEAVLFLTFLVSFILRVMPGIESYEPAWAHAEAYGWVLVGSIALFVATAIGLTVKQVLARRRFRGGLLEGFGDIEGENTLGELTRGNSESAQLGVRDAAEAEASGFTVGQGVAGLSRPASPRRAAPAAEPEPEPALVAAGGPE